jgi:hypothetical protein
MEAGHPSQTNHLPFFFERSEWCKLFPARIMTFLTTHCDRFEPAAGDNGEFYYFPDAARLPLVVAARMSLSFPGLICAVPLWRRDFTRDGEEQAQALSLQRRRPVEQFPNPFFRSPVAEQADVCDFARRI